MRRSVVLAAASITMLAGLAWLPSAAGAPSKPAFYDSAGPVPLPTGRSIVSYDRTSDGASHVVTEVGGPKHSRLLYGTRHHGTSTWTIHRIPGSSLPGLTSASLVVSRDGSVEFLVAGANNGLYVSEKSAAAKNFAEITAANLTVSSNSGSTGGGTSADLLPSVVALPHHRLAVLDVRGPTTATGVLRVLVVRPGHVIRQWTLAGSADTETGGITRDAKTGAVVAVGEQVAASSVNTGTRIAAWTRYPGQHAFGSPHPIAADQVGPREVEQQVSSVTSMEGQVWVGLSRDDDSNVPHGVFVAHGVLHAGSWSPAHRVPHTMRLSQFLLLSADPHRHRLQGIYQSRGDGNRGLMHLTRGEDGIWSTPTVVTHGHADRPLTLVLTHAGGYRYLFWREN
jgi:hypothetical protein